jgi:lipopolysaccharide assembly protein A
MPAILIFLLIIAVLLVIFTLQNSSEITIQLFFWEIKDAPLVVVILSCLFLGYLLASFYFYPRIWKLKSENRKLNKLNLKYEKQQAKESVKDKKDNGEDDPEGIAFDEDDGSLPFFK